MVERPHPIEPEPRASVAVLLYPEQAAWLRNHAGRRGVSAFMRQLLTRLMEDERREIEQVRQRLAAGKGSEPPSAS